MKIILMILILFSWHKSWSQETENTQKTKVIYRKTESHKFTGLKLKGQFKKPELSYIYQRKGIRFEQIVDVPENFNDQIQQGTQKF